MFPADSKILICDDSSFARTMLKNALVELKYWRLLEADNAKAAMTLLSEDEHKKDPIQLLISDVHMPNMTGIELLRWVRSTPHFKELPVIILTSSQEKQDILEAARLGTSHFLMKPFDANILRDRLSSTWSRAGEKWAALNRPKPV